MSVKTRIDREKIESNERIADADRRQRLKETDIQARASIGGQIIGAMGRIASKGGYKNHPSWYKKFISDVSTFANIPTFLHKSRKNAAICSTSFDAQAFTTGTNVLPYDDSIYDDLSAGQVSVVTHYFVPHIGIQAEEGVSGTLDYKNHPINQTLVMDITNIGKVNSRVINPDLSIPGLYLVCTVDYYAMLEDLHYAIDLVTQYDSVDPSIPQSIIEGKGWNYTAFKDDIASWRKVYERLSKYLNQTLPIPKDLDILNRRIWMAHVLIKDSVSEKATYMQFSQFGFNRYIAASNATNLEIGDSGSTTNFRRLTAAKFEQVFMGLINNLIQDDDMLTFIANMRAAIPTSAFFALSGLDQPVVTLTQMDDDIRQQMMNIVTVPAVIGVTAVTDSTYAVRSNMISTQFSVGSDADGNLLVGRTWGDFRSHLRSNAVLFSKHARDCLATVAKIGTFNTFKPTVSQDDILTMTRLHPVFQARLGVDPNDNTKYQIRCLVQSCGTEVVLCSELRICDGVVASTPLYVSSGIPAESELSQNIFCLPIDNLTSLLKVDGMYNCSLTYVRDDNGDYYWESAPLWELDNVFVIPADNLGNLHGLCVRSLWYLDPTLYSKTILK